MNIHPEYLNVPFGRFCFGSPQKLKLDCMYIPSLYNRKMPLTSINRLNKYADEIIFLFSDRPATWVNELREICGHRVKCIIVGKTGYAITYRNRLYNNNISINERPCFDIPLKRSYALHHARESGKKYIGMIDDDILVSDRCLQNGIFALEQGGVVVGYHVPYYPDISSLEHIQREFGILHSPISMTGSLMMLNVDNVRGDFPDVYNEDLLFFMQQADNIEVVSGGCVYQREYDGWRDKKRISHEQFGNIIYNAIKNKMVHNDSSGIIWEKELENEIRIIEEILILDKKHEYSYVLHKAFDAIKRIRVKDIVSFLSELSFGTWVSKYLYRQL